jgi:Ner family transcriptional regulator
LVFLVINNLSIQIPARLTERITLEDNPMVVRNEVGDWLPGYIKLELNQRGYTLRSLSLANGYKEDSLKSVLRTPSVPYELIVAAALETTPETIWPSRWAARKTSYICRAA